MSIPPAWHPDPTGRHDHRWWDGTRWTEHVADAGVSAVDPIDQGGEAGAAHGGTQDQGSAGERASADHGPDGGGSSWTGEASASDDWRSTASHGATGDAAASTPGSGTGDPASPGGHPGSAPTTTDPNWGAPSSEWSGGQPGGGAAGWGSTQPAGEGYGWPAGPTGQGTAPGESGGSDGLAVSAGVIGIVSLVLSIFILGGIGGVVAIVLGGIAMGRVKKSGRKGRGMAITGLVTGILSVIVSILMFVFVINLFQDYDRCVQFTDDPQNCREMSELFGAADLSTP